MNIKLLLRWVLWTSHIIAIMSSGRIWVRKLCKWVGCSGSESKRKVWIWVCFACIWTQRGIQIYWPAHSRGQGWRDERLCFLSFFFWAIQFPTMHQFLNWDFNLQHFSPFHEGIFFLYFSLFNSKTICCLHFVILSAHSLSLFLFPSVCHSVEIIMLFGKFIWKLLVWSAASPFAGSHSKSCRYCSVLEYLTLRLDLLRAKWSAGSWEWYWVPASTLAILQGCAVVQLWLEMVFWIALS